MCIRINDSGSVAFPVKIRNRVDRLAMHWDHSELSPFKSPHTTSIYEGWLESGENDANNFFYLGWYKIGLKIKLRDKVNQANNW